MWMPRADDDVDLTIAQIIDPHPTRAIPYRFFFLSLKPGSAP
jgi:hypothetical protein